MQQRNKNRSKDQGPRDRAGSMEHDPAMSGEKPELGRSMERERSSWRPDDKRRKPDGDDIIR